MNCTVQCKHVGLMQGLSESTSISPVLADAHSPRSLGADYIRGAGIGDSSLTGSPASRTCRCRCRRSRSARSWCRDRSGTRATRSCRCVRLTAYFHWSAGVRADQSFFSTFLSVPGHVGAAPCDREDDPCRGPAPGPVRALHLGIPPRRHRRGKRSLYEAARGLPAARQAVRCQSPERESALAFL